MQYEYDVPDQDENEMRNESSSPVGGQYLLMVEHLDANPENVDGFKAKLQVLSGTVHGMEKRSYVETFFNPSEQSRDGGKFAKKKQFFFLRATDVINPAQKGQRVVINPEDAIGRVFVAFLKDKSFKRKDKNGVETGEIGHSVEIDGLDIYHVTDPAVKHVPMRADVLNALGYVQDSVSGIVSAIPFGGNGGGGTTPPAGHAAPNNPPQPNQGGVAGHQPQGHQQTQPAMAGAGAGAPAGGNKFGGGAPSGDRAKWGGTKGL